MEDVPPATVTNPAAWVLISHQHSNSSLLESECVCHHFPSGFCQYLTTERPPPVLTASPLVSYLLAPGSAFRAFQGACTEFHTSAALFVVSLHVATPSAPIGGGSLPFVAVHSVGARQDFDSCGVWMLRMDCLLEVVPPRLRVGGSWGDKTVVGASPEWEVIVIT